MESFVFTVLFQLAHVAKETLTGQVTLVEGRTEEGRGRGRETRRGYN